jgi:hypothetical protein
MAADESAAEPPSQVAFSPFAEASVAQPPPAPAAGQVPAGDWSVSVVALLVAVACLARLLRMLGD